MQRASDIAEANNDEYSRSFVQQRLAECLMEDGKFTEAARVVRRSLDFVCAHKGHDSDEAAWLHVQLGNCHGALGEYDDATQHFREALRAASRVGNRGICDTANRLIEQATRFKKQRK